MNYELNQETALKAKARWGVYTGGFFGGFGGYHQVLQDPILNDVFGRELIYPNFMKAREEWRQYKRSRAEPADVLMNPDIDAFFQELEEE